ncbi:MAG: molybdate ABC transporter substrate-binding protein [Lachnospiraceae bacterium]|nr:molybdate ABC transporter substrate-binding protein [Lachnospiraceae bacterium]
MKKKLLTMALAAVLAVSAVGCGSSPKQEATAPAENVDLIVFAAASMTETLTEVSELYREVHPDVNITFNFDSSGTLKTQIQEGAPCDLFISAGQKQMNQLDITADPKVNTEGLDYVDETTRINILENKVTLCVTPDNEAGLETFDDMAAALKDGSILMAMGNSDVPVGQYTQKILAYYELNEEELANAGVISYGSNVKEVTTQISEGSVDCGVIYCTDAFSAGLNITDYATAEMCGQVIYPAAVLKTSEQPEAAKDFLDFMLEDQCMAVFEKVGFSPIE